MMRTWIVDASTVAKLFFPENLSSEAEHFFQKAMRESMQLLAPDLIDYELGDICWKRIVRKELSPSESKEVLIHFKKLKIQRINISEFLDDILLLAADENITFYDAAYLYLAIQLDCRLLTADAKLLQGLSDKYRAYGVHLLNIAG